MAKTIIADIRNFQFPKLTIEQGTFVVWRNLDPVAHSAETLRESPNFFNAGALLPGEVSSPVLFQTPGSIDYLCRYHHEMTGQVAVTAKSTGGGHNHTAAMATHGDGHSHGGGGHNLLKHYHGFVTGGRSGQRLYMTHTPVLADQRHHFQIILKASLIEKSHIEAYEKLRKSEYGDRKVQIFHDHLALADIGAGKITNLPEASFDYYPNDPEGGVRDAEKVPGLVDKIPVRIDKVLHFHQFETDADYPDAMTYLLYGDSDDTFIDHYINRAPSFHSVAKLKSCPAFFKPADGNGTETICVPSKKIRNVTPKLVQRVAFVDNAYHLFWLPPTGVYSPQAQDPLIRRDASPAVYEVTTSCGKSGKIDIGRFLHFDVRLLNYGVLITA